ncbi:bifunctional methylenetetrahydrofolate dehydrogenase/cyclohydrolase, mitochondrial isoform X2 [Agrilus planipennis]|uniref:methenyltetrahydrofolate cyclohydrolase n=1 Tax=Agrilus planipennis TaxID=224129 RepID=A0A1W4WIQ7_AGRPL|nr:bifunctional methylenetetrahydrofolate dehydrogenase/cyclohydrolase, mitochondrial isoform X2 [Agrilus planipennis]
MENSQNEAVLLDGIKTSREILNELKQEIQEWVEGGHRAPSLVAILVGNDPASETYVGKKMDAAQKVGIQSKTERFLDTINEEYLIERVTELNKNPDVDGILVQLPLPPNISEERVVNTVAPNKDVDGFHTENLGKLSKNMNTLVPCTAAAVIEIIKRYKIETFGKNVVVCGRSKNVGLPIASILHSDAKYDLQGMEATVTLCHRNTPPVDLEFYCKNADIIISATGVVGLIKAPMVKPGACVIDVGITRIQDENGRTKIVGDVEFNGVKQKVKYITPVPGGVGPMTVAMLMKNTFKAAKLRAMQ